MIKAVIFDMDGLMIDTELLHSDAHAEVIKQHGKEPKIDRETGLVHTVGKSIKENSEKMRLKYDIQQTAEELERQKHEVYFQLLATSKIEPRLGLLELINLLMENKIKTAIGSSGIKKGIQLILKNLKIEKNFPVIVSLEDVKRPKPFPDIFLKAAEGLSVKPKDCLVLEDSQSGVEAAKNAGMKVYAVPNKYTSNQDFSKADLIVDSLSDIKWSTISKI